MDFRPGFQENQLLSPQRCSPLESSTSAAHRRVAKGGPGPECRKSTFLFYRSIRQTSCHYFCPHFSPIQAQWVLTLISLQNPPRRPLFPPPALRAQTSSECEPWEHSRSSSVGDIHWQLAKNGQEQGRLATPDGTFSLPYDATIPCRAKVGIQGEFRKLWG